MDLLARPTGFEPVTHSLEMWGIEYTNDLVLHRFVILQYLFYNVFTKMAQRLTSLYFKTRQWLDNEENKFLYQFCLWLRGAWLMAPGNGTLLPKFILTWHFLLNLFKGSLLLVFSNNLLLVFSNNKVKLKRKKIKWV